MEGWEFSTYLIGTRVPTRITQADEALRARYALDPSWAEPFKQAFNRAVGKDLGILLEKQGRAAMVDFLEPNITLHIDLEDDWLTFRVNPLFIYGRYRKLARGIPQTHWPCRSCQGHGCPHCNHTGKQYPESVEELIADPILAATEGRGAHLHGAGREDIDARMLGNGRPFVLEILEPHRREIDLPTLERAINESAARKVEVAQLRPVSRGLVARVKETKAEKIYQASVAFERPIAPEELTRALTGLARMIEQRTPQRVSHRRPDRVRQRRVLELKGCLIGERQASLKIRCEGGLYIKELISGDAGRTEPSLAALSGTAAEVTELDVLAVCADFEEDAGESRVGHVSSP
jgi:tRNA pseudouridine synthase 10